MQQKLPLENFQRAEAFFRMLRRSTLPKTQLDELRRLALRDVEAAMRRYKELVDVREAKAWSD